MIGQVHLLLLYEIQILLFSDHSKRRGNSNAAKNAANHVFGATPTLRVQEHLQMKLAVVSVWLITS